MARPRLSGGAGGRERRARARRALDTRVDERGEQRRLLLPIDQALGVPLYAHDEAAVHRFEGLDGAVPGPRRHGQALAEVVDGLVVERVHVRVAAAEDRGEAAAGRDRDVVDRLARRAGLAVRDAVADDVGKVLVQRAAAGDVEELRAAADG